MADKKSCGACGAAAKQSVRQQCVHLANATQRMTTGVNGNAFLSMTQHDEYGRTTITREIYKDKIPEYARLVQATPADRCGGNLGLMFMTTLMAANGGGGGITNGGQQQQLQGGRV